MYAESHIRVARELLQSENGLWGPQRTRSSPAAATSQVQSRSGSSSETQATSRPAVEIHGRKRGAKKGGTKTCSLCKKKGHTKRKCPDRYLHGFRKRRRTNKENQLQRNDFEVDAHRSTSDVDSDDHEASDSECERSPSSTDSGAIQSNCKLADVQDDTMCAECGEVYANAEESTTGLDWWACCDCGRIFCRFCADSGKLDDETGKCDDCMNNETIPQSSTRTRSRGRRSSLGNDSYA